ncbi:MAG TPA: aminotransferase class I/II-fold pyridoxal phosphate-dependent enzyme [Rhizomicrobium sp.]|jgi:8-amino-7-oxononanoate synthase|nr:aminotransferase class I/II-fold pyridoxal phosphate-dependent enzyme [Rhizomicrobium sp.]
MPSLDHFAKTKLAALEAVHLRRSLVETARHDGLWVTRGQRRLLSFSCNDYLNLTHHPRVKAAAVAAVETYGAGAGASRLVSGNHPLYAELEARLAALKGTEAACVFGSGYLANAGIVPVLVGEGDLLLVDALSHACLWAGARLSRATVSTFRHNDVAHAAELLAAQRGAHRHALIVTDRVFSMDGDLAPLAELSALAHAHDAWLMSDDAHGLAVVPGGNPADIQMGTLSKALGSYGGYVCASRPVIDLIATRARTLIYSTGLPPASVAAALAALAVIADAPALAARPLAKAQRFARALDLAPAQSPIVPLVLGDAAAALAASQRLEREGFLVAAIRPPTVPPGTARLRFAFTAGHPDAEIARLMRVVQESILA